MSKISDERLTKVKKVSKETYGDDIHENIKDIPKKDLVIHKRCLDKYTLPSCKKKVPPTDETEERSAKRMRSFEPAYDEIKHCLFCGSECNVKKDQKNPSRWREAYLCLSVEGTKTLNKELILERCKQKGDKQSEDVRFRLVMVKDLAASDCRYHKDCYSKKNSNDSSGAKASQSDIPFKELLKIIDSDVNEVWTSSSFVSRYSELCKTYSSPYWTKKWLIQKICSHYWDRLVALSSIGHENMFVFKKFASNILKLKKSDEEDCLSGAISHVGKAISKELMECSKSIRDDVYHLGPFDDITESESSETLQKLLECIHKNVSAEGPPAQIINSILLSFFTQQSTSLQCMLGGYFRNIPVKRYEKLSKYNITCSYDELKRLRTSSAKFANDNIYHINLPLNDSLVQIVVDNFDLDLCTPNGKAQTHSLGVIVTKNESPLSEFKKVTDIPRIRHTERRDAIEFQVEVKRYQGPKNPEMNLFPSHVTESDTASTKILHDQAVLVDMEFFREILSNDNCPEFNGFNTKRMRDMNMPSEPKTIVHYRPLIDMVPAEPDTMLTAMCVEIDISEQSGQDMAIFTCDQQLYKIAVQIQWNEPERFNDMIIRLGGMHMFMSFLGSIGSLMKGTGLEQIMATVFGGVKKMLDGKKYPDNFRALRIVAEELLRDVIDPHNFETTDDLLESLNENLKESKTSRVWINNFLKPLFIAMRFVRAERECEFLLHLSAGKEMIPYFFAAGHHHYARWGIQYINQLEGLDGDVKERFLKGEHTVRHNSGLWNTIWTDMMIEQTLMNVGKSPGGLKGVTLKPEVVKKWAFSLNTFGLIDREVEEYFDNDYNKTQPRMHKEENNFAIKRDKTDREKIRSALQNLMNPLDKEQLPHHKDLINIFTGQIADEDCNLDDAVQIGTKQSQIFLDSLPEGFYNTISHQVKSMTPKNRKKKDTDSTNVIDTNLIYSRALVLTQNSSTQSCDSELTVQYLLTHELFSSPLPLFYQNGEMRIAKNKSTLKNKLKVEVISRTVAPQIRIVDASAILWAIAWPSKGALVKDLIVNVRYYLQDLLKSSDVYFVFDRYFERSIKSQTRSTRSNGITRRYGLSLQNDLPPKKQVLAVSENKKQLIQLIIDDLMTNPRFQSENKLIVTGMNPGEPPFQIYQNNVTTLDDLQNFHEEADVIMIHQLLYASEQSDEPITVVCDDTDVFLLLLHFYKVKGSTNEVYLEETSKERKVISIRESIEKIEGEGISITDILPLHALTGCDTVSKMCGIEKVKPLNLLKKDNEEHLDFLSDIENPDFEETYKKCVNFVSKCYNMPSFDTMNELRYEFWLKKIGSARKVCPPLENLPSTDSSFREHVKMAMFQLSIWLSADKRQPSDSIDAADWGWYEIEMHLMPIMTPDDVQIAPDSVLKLIRCNCKAQNNRCGENSRCGCATNSLPCTKFCNCDFDGMVCSRSLENTTAHEMEEDEREDNEPEENEIEEND